MLLLLWWTAMIHAVIADPCVTHPQHLTAAFQTPPAQWMSGRASEKSIQIWPCYVQAASLNGTNLHQSNPGIWHGTMDYAAWHEEGGAYYPKICCRPIGTSHARFADDMQSSPSLNDSFKHLLLQPQQARFVPQAGEGPLECSAPPPPPPPPPPPLLPLLC